MLKMRWALVVALAISAPLYPESVDLPPLDAPSYRAIRDLQYQQDKLIIRLDNLKLEETKVQADIDARQRDINQKAYDAARAAKLDVDAVRLDLDKLEWKKGSTK